MGSRQQRYVACCCHVDIPMLMTELDKLLRFIARHQVSMISSPIPPSGHIPPAFLETLVSLESGVSKTIASEKSAGKKMAPAKGKALNIMKQTLKKKIKEFEAVVATYNEVGPIVDSAVIPR